LTATAVADFPVALDYLFEPARYKVAYGGRGAAKSWGFARALLIMGLQRPLRVLCARETQKSISDSVHHLLESQVRDMGMMGQWTVEKARIYAANGSEFIFAGLRHNINNIKSVEACDVVWVEEAQSVSKHSWETLIPTIRKDGSEIWVSFNPELDTDDTYARFVLHPPPTAVVRKVSWRDNPWMPKVLIEEMRHLKNVDARAYDHVYEGNCRSAVEGAVYEAEMAMLEREGRIRKVPYTHGVPVQTYWDLGHADATAIWFVQALPGEYRLLEYEEMTGGSVSSVVKMLQSKGYVYGSHNIPHDGKHQLFAAGGRSVQQQIQALGLQCRIVPDIGITNGLNAVRTILPQCWFDADKCADGLQALRHYRWPAASASGVVAKEPLHDWSSHCADALRYMAVDIKAPSQAAAKPKRQFVFGGGTWS